MNAIVDQRTLESAAVEAEFALARSRCIDACADLEVRVGLALKKLGLSQNRDCLGRRVASLTKAKPSPALSKANAVALADWVAKTEVLVAQRAWLVHSRMDLGKFGTEWRASFANAFDVAAGHPMVLLSTLMLLDQIQRAVTNQGDRLGELIQGLNPAV